MSLLIAFFSGYAADDARAFKIARMSLLDSETPCDAFLLFCHTQVARAVAVNAYAPGRR
jgi:hypothetical protein